MKTNDVLSVMEAPFRALDFISVLMHMFICCVCVAQILGISSAPMRWINKKKYSFRMTCHVSSVLLNWSTLVGPSSFICACHEEGRNVSFGTFRSLQHDDNYMTQTPAIRKAFIPATGLNWRTSATTWHRYDVTGAWELMFHSITYGIFHC